MGQKSTRELELIIQRLNSQIDSKNEQIAELNAFIQQATDNTQELIRNFRAFCIKVLESELAYGDITSRDLESMTLNELLARARNMLKQNQEKARSIYDTFKERLTQKNMTINGLIDQVSQLKYMIDNAEKVFTVPYEEPNDLQRNPAYLIDTDTPVDALRPAVAVTTVLDENERVVSFEGAADKDAVELVSDAKMYVQDLDKIKEQLTDAHWDALSVIVENGVSEMSKARQLVCEKVLDNGENIGTEKATRIVKFLVTLMIFNQIKINTGMRWFMILSLSDIGNKLYTERYHKRPAETEFQKIVREHDNATHGYTIKDVAQILTDTGRYRSVSMSRKGNLIKLPDGRVCIPDIVCCLHGGIEYYEVECGNHHQSDFSDKCNKMKSFTQNLYFVAPNREIVAKKLKPQVDQWIKEVGREQLQMSCITVYLTSISDLAAGRWTYIYNMQDEKPLYTPTPASKKKEKEESE